MRKVSVYLNEGHLTVFKQILFNSFNSKKVFNIKTGLYRAFIDRLIRATYRTKLTEKDLLLTR